jgi:choline dehydrogenase
VVEGLRLVHPNTSLAGDRAPLMHTRRPHSVVPTFSVVTDTGTGELRAGRCIGVEYSVGTEAFVAGCSGEGVLTAGTVGSAQLLMLLAPAGHLNELARDVVVDLPGVGSNLHDHSTSGIVYRSAQPVPADVNNHGEAMGLIRSDAAIDTPDLQIIFVDVPLREDTLRGPDMGAGYTIMVALMLAQSRGSVRLADAAAAGTAPVIDPNYYTEPRDLVAVADGLRAARKIGGAPALGRWRGEEVLPGREMRSEQNLRAYPRTNLRSYSHYADTCRIGLAEDGVVDTDLRVHGISGLRVADASVMPLPISANTNPTVYAIAERAAVLLRA